MKEKIERKNEILKLIDFVSEAKKIDRVVLVGFLKNAIQRIVSSQLDPDAEIDLEIVEDGLLLVNRKKVIIDDNVEYEQNSKVIDIHLSEAREINPNVKVGETIESRIFFDDFSRSLFAKIEQSFRIEIINWEKRRIYEKYQPLIGTVVHAKLEEDFAGKGATFLLEDQTLCYMPSKYQNKNIKLNDKKYHDVTIEEVYENSKTYQVLVSNDSPNKVREILKREIPEIERGEILIVGISRIKGIRSKISFRQNPKYEGELDVKGCIIGKDSERINRVSDEIGEKIDVVLYSDNILEYIANALSPAKIVSINKKTGTNDYLVVVPNSHNTIAIGKKGINVKLTVELIRVNIDICSYSYAIENNIPLNWNGNVTEEELKQIDANYVEGQPSIPFSSAKRHPRPNNKQNSWRVPNNINSDFDKEIAEFNSEILSYKSLDLSEYGIGNNFSSSKEHKEINDSSDDLFDEESLMAHAEQINTNEIRKANENFKFDKDLAGDLDLSNFDFDDFDDDDSK